MGVLDGEVARVTGASKGIGAGIEKGSAAGKFFREPSSPYFFVDFMVMAKYLRGTLRT
jgi:hypothetical protein